MGMAAERADRLADDPGLLGLELVQRPQVIRRFANQVARELDREIQALEVIRPFAVAERDDEEHLLPHVRQRSVVAVREALAHEVDRALVLRECARRVAHTLRENWSSATMSASRPRGVAAHPSNLPSAARSVMSAKRSTIDASAPPRIARSRTPSGFRYPFRRPPETRTPESRPAHPSPQTMNPARRAAMIGFTRRRLLFLA